jgi:hypothetical protein
MSNARNLQTLGLICFLAGFIPVTLNERSLMVFVVIILPVGGILFLVGLYLNGWKFYDAGQETVVVESV